MHKCKCIVATLYQLHSKALFRVTVLNYVRAVASIHAAEPFHVCIGAHVCYDCHACHIYSTEGLFHLHVHSVTLRASRLLRTAGGGVSSRLCCDWWTGDGCVAICVWFKKVIWECRGWWLFKKLVKEMRDLSRWLWPLTMCYVVKHSGVV